MRTTEGVPVYLNLVAARSGSLTWLPERNNTQGARQKRNVLYCCLCVLSSGVS